MAEGALTELVAIGGQNEDVLTDDLKKSIFQNRYKKITNFSKKSFNTYANGNLNWGNSFRFKIERKGDLLYTTYLVLKLPDISVKDIITKNPIKKNELLTDLRVLWSNFLGNAAVETVKLFIGGQLIDEQTGEYLLLHTDVHEDWNRLFMSGHDGNLNRPNTFIKGECIYIPLKFWFTATINKALPLIALQYHDVEIEVKLRKWGEITNVLRIVKDETGRNMMIHTDYKIKEKNVEDVHLDCTYVYLSSEERKQIAQNEHKILITQTQYRTSNLNKNEIDLDFNHIVKEILFYVQPERNVKEAERENLSGKLNFLPSKFNDPEYISKVDENGIATIKASKDLYDDITKQHNIERARILFNGIERVEWKDYKFFYYKQCYENFKNPNKNHFYLYSFSANSRSLDNYGGCNFSRIDNSQLQFELSKDTERRVSRLHPDVTVKIGHSKQGKLNVFAHNYNVLIIKSGMAGLKYSN